MATPPTSPRPRSMDPAVLFGALLLVLGGLFLLRNAGLVRLDWGVIWPLLLVGVGAIVILGAVRGRRDGGVERWSVPRDGVTRLELALRLGAGRYRVESGETELVEAVADDPEIDAHAERIGSLARVRLSPSVAGWPWMWQRSGSWRIRVAPGVPVALDLQAGAGDFDLDLAALTIADARLQVGAASLRIVLFRPRGDQRVRIECGATALTLEVPPGVAARVSATGLVSVEGPRETLGYDAAVDRLAIEVTGAAASVKIVPLG